MVTLRVWRLQFFFCKAANENFIKNENKFLDLILPVLSFLSTSFYDDLVNVSKLLGLFVFIKKFEIKFPSEERSVIF